MNCEEARLLIGANPGADDAGVAEHVAQCADCARYRQELRDMDRVLYAALRVDFDAVAPRSARMRSARISGRPIWAIAASLLVIVVGTFAWLLSPRDAFAAQVVDHVNGEAFSLVRTSEAADPLKLEGILSRAGVRLKVDAAPLVSYASGCEFRGHIVPHLVVQTERGPVTVMVLADETLSGKSRRIDEGGYSGVVVPAPRGVLVVLGQDGNVEAVAATVLNSLDYGW
jgi:hypothetical protein